MFETVKKLLAKQLRIDESKITLESGIQSDLGADSLDILQLLMTIEEEHGIVIPEKERFSNAVLCSKIWTCPKKAEGKAAKMPSADSLDSLSNPD